MEEGRRGRAGQRATNAVKGTIVLIVLAAAAAQCGAQENEAYMQPLADVLCQENTVQGNPSVTVCPNGVEQAGTCQDSVPLDAFCANSDAVNAVSGAILGAPAVDPSYFELVMYWAPSFCTNDSVVIESSLCSEYTSMDYPAATQLSILSLQPHYCPTAQPAYCVSESLGDYSRCWELASLNATQCEELIIQDGDTNLANLKCGEGCFFPTETNQQYNTSGNWQTYAPAWAGPNDATNEGNIAWMQYGSCMGESVGASEYVEIAGTYADLVITGPGLIFSANIGQSVNMTELHEVFPNNTGSFECSADCAIEQVTVCIEPVHEDGAPGQVIPCPLNTISDSCSSCESITVPMYEGQVLSPTIREVIEDGWDEFVGMVEEATEDADEFWSDVGDTLEEGVNLALDTVQNGTESAFVQFVDFATDTVTAVQEGLEDFLNTDVEDTTMS